jgi:hypothetical protein
MGEKGEGLEANGERPGGRPEEESERLGGGTEFGGENEYENENDWVRVGGGC